MHFTKIVALAGLASLAHAHMEMTNPTPFSSPALSNSPLDASGSDFPCKTTGGTFEGTANEYALGSKQTLKLKGSAVHGGGSCQISLSIDTNPTKSSVWKVIHSIEGGCPSRTQAGNYPANADMVDPDTYDFTIPSDIPAGSYTLAWSWVNTVGNREFYMNCGAVKLTGTGGTSYESLPEMFVANLANINTCATTEDINVLFPDPGTSVETNANSFKTGLPSGSMCSAQGKDTKGSGSSSSGGSSSGSGSGSSAAASSVATAAPSASSATSAPGGVFVTVPTSASGAATTGAAMTTTATTSVAPATSTSAGTGSGSGSSSSGLTGACTTEGTWNCVGGTSYQQCASGTWSVVMPMAAGTSCTPGQSATLVLKAGLVRRQMRAFRA